MSRFFREITMLNLIKFSIIINSITSRNQFKKRKPCNLTVFIEQKKTIKIINQKNL